jgi:hypothetical protein
VEVEEGLGFRVEVEEGLGLRVEVEEGLGFRASGSADLDDVHLALDVRQLGFVGRGGRGS